MSQPLKKDLAEFKKYFGKRSPKSHKGDYGHGFLIAGSTGMTGAACLAAHSALRSGCGLVTVGCPKSLNPILERKLTEEMTLPLQDKGRGYLGQDSVKAALTFSKKVDVVAIGPGLSQKTPTQSVVRKLYKNINKPIVLDADGLNAFQKHVKQLKEHKSDVVITPHPGEFKRLFGALKGMSRVDQALKIARRYKLTVVLKGHETVVATYNGKKYINKTGNAGMATGGTGDCLTGIIVSFLAQGLLPFDAAKHATLVHGFAGDIAAKKLGKASLIASDLLNYLPTAFKRLI